jgi:Tol biopolymer transport system component
MKQMTVVLGLAAAGAAGGALAAARTAPPAAPEVQAAPAPTFAFAEPGISPDGREIAFASGGDLWSVPAAGGEARLLVTDPANERRPMYSPDGRELAFVSTRTGGGDVYVLTLASGDLRRVTWNDGPEQLDGWSRDGQWIYFSSTSHDIAGMNDVFRVPAAGGTPFAVSDERYVNEFSAAASPDGRRIVFVARGISSAQWWRRGSSHIDESELWVRDVDGPADPIRLAARGARHVWPMWSGDGRRVFYVSDRGGVENIWVRAAASDGEARPLTAFRDGRVLWPTSTADGRTIAFERDFGIWTLDVDTGAARPLPISRRGAPTGPAPERVRQTSDFTGLALSPDGRKIAFVARGDVFAASARDAADATRVTATDAIEAQPAWAPDSRRLVFVSAEGRGQRVQLHDFTTGVTSALTDGAATDLSPAFSPDGARLAFLRDRRELRVIDLASRSERIVATGVFGDTIDSPVPAWSPDGRWIALLAIGAKAFTNVEMVPADGGVMRPVSFVANAYANSIAWSRDGRYLLFDTRQRTEPGQLARVDLVPRAPTFREDLFRDLFTDPHPEPRNPEPEPRNRNPEPGTLNPEPVFANLRQRLSFLPTGLDVVRAVISPDGKTAAIVGAAAGQTNLYAWSLDDLAADPVARQLTTTPGVKTDPQFTADSRDVLYLDNGRVHTVNVERRDARPLVVTAEFTADFAAERRVVFDQAWRLLQDNFFDSSFRGVDWAASRERYGARAAAAGTPDELRRVMSLMMGDLNASHMGISAQGAAPVIGRLGLRFDRREFEAGGRLRVTSVVPLGPAALAGGISTGDLVVAVDGRSVTPRFNLDEALAYTIDRRTVLTLSPAGGGPARDVALKPTTQASEKALVYREWVEANREYVLKASGGRLGYVHMINMSAAALEQLHLDLDIDNHRLDGVVVDLRNNNGGFVHAYALDVFSRQPYLRMSTRSVPEAPARGVLGQRALESPTVLVTNQHSLSDAEDFAEGYRALKLGPVVGEPTAGWIIYTWDVRLIDGSTLRLPRMRVKAADGGEMELAPRKVDVVAERPLGESRAGKDSQLDEAIRTLLKRIGRAE